MSIDTSAEGLKKKKDLEQSLMPNLEGPITEMNRISGLIHAVRIN